MAYKDNDYKPGGRIEVGDKPDLIKCEEKKAGIDYKRKYRQTRFSDKGVRDF